MTQTSERPLSFHPLTLEELQQDTQKADKFILSQVEKLKDGEWWQWMQDEYVRESSSDPDLAYPSQGLRLTEYDGALFDGVEKVLLDEELFEETVHAWLYYLELFNHPERLKHLSLVDSEPFVAPKKVENHPIFTTAKALRRALAINELALHASGAEKTRTKRKKRFEEGPFIKLGRQARSHLVGSANPEVWGSVPALASMAMAHSLVGVPRDGVFKDVQRQADLYKKAVEWLENSPVLEKREEKVWLLDHWKRNLMGVLEANGYLEGNKATGGAIERATVLYEAGMRTFRIYSPEPGSGPLETLQALRELEKQENWESIEIFVGQVVSVEQAKQLEAAGADGIYIGIGGGGRCTTGVRGNLAIDWPQLVWELRGEISIPVIVEGGASENIGTSFALGATGIGVTRIVGGGTIESPGGKRYLQYENALKKRLFKPYGGEASARMKAMGGKVGPQHTIPYVEGETTAAYLPEGRENLPTLLQRLFLLTGDTIVSMVFQNADSIAYMQENGPVSLRQVGPGDAQIRNTH